MSLINNPQNKENNVAISSPDDQSTVESLQTDTYELSKKTKKPLVYELYGLVLNL